MQVGQDARVGILHTQQAAYQNNSGKTTLHMIPESKANQNDREGLLNGMIDESLFKFRNSRYK